MFFSLTVGGHPCKYVKLTPSLFFQASGNQISSLEGLERQLGDKKDLETIYLEHNPVQRTEGTAYRRKISLALPQLKQIDAT